MGEAPNFSTIFQFGKGYRRLQSFWAKLLFMHSILFWDTRALYYSFIRDLRIKSHKYSNQCDFALVLACNLRIHLKTHTGETPHKCNRCRSASIIASNLKRQMKKTTYLISGYEDTLFLSIGYVSHSFVDKNTIRDEGSTLL